MAKRSAMKVRAPAASRPATPTPRRAVPPKLAAARRARTTPPASTPDNAAGAHAPPGSRRIEGLDALRGLAIAAMIVYHFCFDLRYFRITRWDFEHDVRWLTARALILSSFLLIAGISAVLAERRAPSRTHWLRHVGVIALAALFVSAGSYLMFPQSFIWFGVLHAIALSLLLARPLLGRPWLAAPIGVAVIVAGILYSHAAFDNRALGFLGFMTVKPVTEDYVPLFPWMGVLLVGVALGHALVRTQFAAVAPLAHVPRALRFVGRHSLLVYLVHQPVMIALLWAATS